MLQRPHALPVCPYGRSNM